MYRYHYYLYHCFPVYLSANFGCISTIAQVEFSLQVKFLQLFKANLRSKSTSTEGISLLDRVGGGPLGLDDTV